MFASGDSAFKSFYVQVVQIAFFKPASQLVIAIVETVNDAHGTHPNSKNALSTLMRVVSVISIGVTIVAILRIYKFLSAHPDEPLSGHLALAKFLVIKILFVFVIINQLFLVPLIIGSFIPIGNWICTPYAICSQMELQYCQNRLIEVIFAVEVLIMTIPAVATYRHHQLSVNVDLNKSDVWTTRRKRVGTLIFYIFLTPLDLSGFIYGRLDQAFDPVDAEQREDLLAES